MRSWPATARSLAAPGSSTRSPTRASRWTSCCSRTCRPEPGRPDAVAGFGFLAPLFLLGSLAVAIPVVLHLLRQRADPVQPFSAVHLLQHSRVEQARRRRLRDILLFALRAAAVIVLAIAFARPYFRGASPADPPVAVVVA